MSLVPLMNSHKDFRLGAWPESESVFFRVWAPKYKKVSLIWWGEDESAEPLQIEMLSEENGYFSLKTAHAFVGGLYKYRLNDEEEFPDPTSLYQPRGPQGPSQVVSREFSWTDRSWKGHALEDLVIYELHIGCFTSKGDIESMQDKLSHLKRLGVTAVEIMPVAQFAGERNWGYDGVGVYAVQNSYSKHNISALALKQFVDRCHAEGLAVFLDVVYNHLGPEGNYLSRFGNYFQDKYKTSWGEALNFDGPGSDEVRWFFLQNARQWLEDFHFDGLRLDAVHAIFDTSARPFLQELAEFKKNLESKCQRRMYLIAESDANDSRLVTSVEENGIGMDAQWADDLHHILHGLLTGERQAYYTDYGEVEQLVHTLRRGLYFEGQYSEGRRRRHGRSYEKVEAHRLVVCSQNHDQIGNRKEGDRLIELAGPEKQKLAAACVFLSGAMPLMFMGEEIAERSPFQYFVDPTDEQLLEAIRRGRKEEFSAFQWQGEIPDPAAQSTFEASKLKWDWSKEAEEFFTYYRRLISLSRFLRNPLKATAQLKVEQVKQNVILMRYAFPQGTLLIYLSFISESTRLKGASENYRLLLSSSEKSKVENDMIDLAAYSALVMGDFNPLEVL